MTTLPITDIDETTALLIRARSFVESGWCRGVMARERSAREVAPTSRYAVAWCAFGALIAAGMPHNDYDDEYIETQPAFIRLYKVHKPTSIGEFNDAQKTVEPVLAAFDRAIAG